MTIDGITLRAVVEELQMLVGAKIEKIYQPEREEIVLLLHTKQGKRRLVINAGGSECRLHLTNVVRQNPEKAPNFCMLLRKYIASARILRIEQEGLERIVRIWMTARDEIGVENELCLVCEIMGKYSNVMLLKEDKILDSMHRVPLDVSSVRQVLPGMPYQLPPLNKKNPLTVDEETLRQSVAGGKLMQNLQGISKQAEREIFYRCFSQEEVPHLLGSERAETETLAVQTRAFIEEQLQKKRPCVQKDRGMPFFFSAAPYQTMPEEGREYYNTVNEAVDASYCLRQSARLLEEKRSALKKHMRRHIARVGKKLALQTESLHGKEESEKYRVFGELISANIYQIKRGAEEVELYNYYTDLPEKIKLDPALPASANAEAYFKKANKRKTAAALAKERCEQYSAELAFLENLEYDLLSATTQEDVEEVRLDMIKYGYLPKPQNAKRLRRVDPLEHPMHFVTSDGFRVFAGRNNRQNDALTFHVAGGEDIWFHAKGVPGSHVILFLEGREPTDLAIEECAKIAATHSRAAGGKAEVDYTRVKNVWKANGAKPGMVLFKAQKTIVVDP